MDLLDRQTLFDGFVAAQHVTEEPHHLDSEQVFLVLAQYDMGPLLFRIEHPLFPLTCMAYLLPSSQSMVLGMRTSLFLSDRIVKTSKKLVGLSKCNRCSSLTEYIMINYHSHLLLLLGSHCCRLPLIFSFISRKFDR